jgi:hypothetical protein
MNKSSAHSLKHQAISTMLLVTLFAWVLADETQLSVAHQQTKLLKNSAEWVNFQLNFSKESYSASHEKDLNVATPPFFESSSLALDDKLVYEFIAVNRYQRNPFYEFTSINAP